MACVAALPALAGSVLKIGESRAIAISNQAQAVTYGFSGNQAPSGYIVDASLDDFLLCNHFKAQNGAADPSTFESVYLRPRHGGWLFGRQDIAGVMGSVTGIRGVSYGNGILAVDSCPADGTGCAASSGNLGASLQCYSADPHGGNVADTRSLFSDAFEGSYDDAPHNSWVTIRVTHRPTSANDTFNYEISIHLPPAGGQLQNLTGGSEWDSAYILREGYDQSVFSSCTALLSDGGQKITASTTTPIQRSCSMIDYSTALPTDVPVVSAALFTSAATRDDNPTDNVAFGYPVETGALAKLSVTVTTAGGQVSATGGSMPMGGGIQQCDSASAGATNCSALYAPGSSAELTATAAAGHAFSGWGNACAGATGAVANLLVTSNMVCSASFTSLHYAVDAAVGTGQGTITPASQSVLFGDAASFSVNPAANHHVVSVLGNTCTPTVAPTDATQYTAANIQGDCQVTANFAIDQVTVTVTNQYANGLLIRSGESAPAGSYTVDYGSSLVFSAQAYAGYHFDGASGCAGVADTVANTYTIMPVVGDCAVTASFVANQ